MNKCLTLLSYRDLDALGYGSRTTIWRKVKDGEFPPPIDLGHDRKGWLESDIVEWLQSRKTLL